MSEIMELAVAAQEGEEVGTEEYILIPRDHRTSGCLAAVAGAQVLHATRQDCGVEKSVNGLLPRRSGDGGGSGGSGGGEQRRMVDITRDKPIKVTVRIMVPVRDHPKFNFVGKLLGPKGNSLKRLQEDTMTKMAILGRGSMRDKHKEEELRTSGDPKFSHLNDDLHVEVTAFAPPAEAHARIAYALAEVRRFLVPDYNDEIRQEQMWEMQILNTQRQPGGLIGDLLATGGDNQSNHSSATSNDSRNGSLSPASPPPSVTASAAGGGNEMLVTAQELLQHPALRGMDQRVKQTSLSTSGGNVCRKRPLIAAAGTRLAMSPTKRTVLSILARARAAQAKDLCEYQTTNGRGNGITLLREDITGSNLA